jgi:predicted transcriptional regulator
MPEAETATEKLPCTPSVKRRFDELADEEDRTITAVVGRALAAYERTRGSDDNSDRRPDASAA